MAHDNEIHELASTATLAEVIAKVNEIIQIVNFHLLPDEVD